MVQSLNRNQFSNYDRLFVSDLTDVKIFSAESIDEECWQTYYKDLSLAALKIRSLITK